jgi:hypothetical protein
MADKKRIYRELAGTGYATRNGWGYSIPITAASTCWERRHQFPADAIGNRLLSPNFPAGQKKNGNWESSRNVAAPKQKVPKVSSLGF